MEIKDLLGDYDKKFVKVEEDNRRIIGDVIYEWFGKKHGNIIYPLLSRYDHEDIKSAWLAFLKSGKTNIQYFLGILNKK